MSLYLEIPLLILAYFTLAVLLGALVGRALGQATRHYRAVPVDELAARRRRHLRDLTRESQNIEGGYR